MPLATTLVPEVMKTEPPESPGRMHQPVLLFAWTTLRKMAPPVTVTLTPLAFTLQPQISPLNAPPVQYWSPAWARLLNLPATYEFVAELEDPR